jgi:hypothetical protein
MPNNDGNDLVNNPNLEESEGIASYPAQKFATNRFTQSFYTDPYAAEYSDDITNDGYTPFVPIEARLSSLSFTASTLADSSFIYSNFLENNSALLSFDGYNGFLAEEQIHGQFIFANNKFVMSYYIAEDWADDEFPLISNTFFMSYDGVDGLLAEDQGGGYFILDEFLMSSDGYDGFLAKSYADADGYFTLSELIMGGFESEYWGCGSLNGGVSTGTFYYKMIARDVDCPSLSYVTWVVLDSPDSFGAFYIGPKCGPNPLADIAIEATWFIPN